MAAPRALLPDAVVAGGSVREGAAVTIAEGRIAAVGPPPPGVEVVRLPGRALLPGLVSAHSHAFQRAIRGRTERRAPRPGPAAGAATPAESFWTWRTAMYAAANRLSPEDLQAVSRMCFREMARAGITTVGEFHYLHRDPDGRPYADPAELEKRVLAAAREAGVRIVLLRAAYARAGYGLPEEPQQRRFVEPSVDAYLRGLEATEAAARESGGDAVAPIRQAQGRLRPAQGERNEAGSDSLPAPLASVGIAPHSVRACPAEWIRDLAAEARRRGMPLHLHVAEQPAEVEACRAEHGRTPVALLERLGALGPATTAVHAIHLDQDDVRRLGAAGAGACLCPTTERNLGDGVAPADRLLAAGVRLALGTDANAQIDLLEDARELEYHLRLTRLARLLLDEPPGALPGRLLDAATAGGMAALGLAGGRLAPGEPADLVAIDLDDPSIAGAEGEALLATIVFALARTAVREVWVGGEPVIADGRAAPGRLPDEAISAEFRAAMRRVWSG